jgi:hypothetical protein
MLWLALIKKGVTGFERSDEWCDENLLNIFKRQSCKTARSFRASNGSSVSDLTP